VSKSLTQFFIFILTFLGVVFINMPGALLVGQCFGLAAQPFWLYETGRTRQWGMFALALVFVFLYAFGIYNSIIG